MIIREYARILRKHLRLIVLLCLSAAISATLLTYLIAEKYEAMALVLVGPQGNIKLSSNKEDKELLNFPVGGGIVKAETPSNTYIEIIKSRAIAEKVVRTLQLDRDRELPATTYYKKVVAFLRKKSREFVRVTRQILKYGRVMGPPPAFEKAVEDFQKDISLKAIKDAYIFEIKYSTEDREEAAAGANAAAALFLEHMAEINVNQAKGILEFVGERLHKAERELAEARRASREFKERNKTISFKDETIEEIKIIAALESDFEKVQAKLAGLMQKFTTSNPQVQSVQAERDSLLLALGERKNRMNSLPEKERQLAALNLNVQVAEEIYQTIKKEYEQGRIREGMKINEMKIASRAVVPIYPSKPIRYYYVGAGLALALLIGIGLAFFLEDLNTTIQSIEHVEKVLQLRVLATLPQMEFTPKP